ncbi:MAG: cupin domain-containing protein [Myxococcales bacterium]|nr:cupin domain-containing protein [Myxococcales bacterium]
MHRLFLLGACLALPLCPAAAQPAGAAAASVTPAEKAPRKVAPSGKAWITLLAQGEQAFVGRLEMAPGTKVPEHQDPTEEYIHVLEGTGVLTLDGVAHPVKPGDTIFMPAHAKVSYVNGPARFVGLQVFAGPGPAKKYAAWAAAPAQ